MENVTILRNHIANVFAIIAIFFHAGNGPCRVSLLGFDPTAAPILMTFTGANQPIAPGADATLTLQRTRMTLPGL